MDSYATAWEKHYDQLGEVGFTKFSRLLLIVIFCGFHVYLRVVLYLDLDIVPLLDLPPLLIYSSDLFRHGH